jgi:uridine kinase
MKKIIIVEGYLASGKSTFTRNLSVVCNRIVNILLIKF